MDTRGDGLGCLTSLVFILVFGVVALPLGGAGAVVSLFLGVGTFQSSGVREVTAPPPQTTMLEIVMGVAGEPVDAAQWAAASAVIEARLVQLTLDSSIASDYTLIDDPAAQRLTVKLVPQTLTPEDIIQFLTATGSLEFVDLSGVPNEALMGYVGQPIVTSAQVERTGDTSSQIVFPTILSSTDFDASLGQNITENGFGGWQIEINLTAQGAAKLASFSEANIGKGLAIVFDGKVIAAPILQTRVETPVIITFATDTDIRELEAIRRQLNSVPIPIPLSVQSLN